MSKPHCKTCGDYKELSDGTKCPDCYLPIHHTTDIIKDCINCFRDCKHSGKTGGTVCGSYSYASKNNKRELKSLISYANKIL